VTTLGTVLDPLALVGLAGFLRDPHPEVRAAAVTAAVDGTGEKWANVREAVKAALADPRLAADGALPGAAGHLSAVALCDLTQWAGDAEPLGSRSIKTLVDHYGWMLQTGADYDLVVDLGHQVTAQEAPPGLRVELATLMRSMNLLTPELLDRMTNAEQPGPIRLLAAEALLVNNPADSDGIDVLRGLGRQSNREMSLAIARVLQQYLAIDVGLPPGGFAPKSKEAGDVAKRVLAWASSKSAGVATPGLPLPGLIENPRPAGRAHGAPKIW
ncbi:MAG: hypothetical protein ACRCZF_03665, partial [Gemmataceae bacterium]